MRGVHRFQSFRMLSYIGSSPHARGPRVIQMAGYHYYRIIPACAGSTAVSQLRLWLCLDHPRMRGVHLLRKQ